MKKITSMHNTEIKQIVKLRTKKERYAQQKYIAEGIRSCSTLAQKHELLQVYVTEDMYSAAAVFTDPAQITEVSASVMSKMSSATTPSGIIGIFRLPPLPSFSLLSPGLVLAHIANPGNMGTLIRSAAAMNVKTVVVIEGADPFCPKVVQASAGDLAHVTIFQTSWPQLLAKRGSLLLCALIARGGNPPEELNLRHSLLIVGNEAHGINPTWINDCQQKLTLTMPGNTESLNAAVAGSIALYLATQQVNV